MVLKQETPPFAFPGTGKSSHLHATLYFRIISDWDVPDLEGLSADSQNSLN